MSNASVIELNSDSFETEVLKSDQPVLVDFWAPWCGPCKMLGPVIDEIAQEKAGTVKVAKLNVDDSPQLAAQYQIQSIPALLIFKNGEVADKLIGAVPKANILAKLDAVV